MANFMDEQAPGGGTWRSMCQDAEPQLDGQGLLIGAWGGAIRAAVQFEKTQGQGHFADMPCGQVIDFMMECGHEPFEEAAGATEKAAQHGQAQVIGMPMDNTYMGADMAGGGLVAMGQMLLPHGSLTVRQVNQNGCDPCAPCFTGCKHFPCCCCLSTSEFFVEDMNGNVFLSAIEESEPWERMCCTPCHAATIKVSDPGSGQVLVTLERKGLSNCHCVCCFSCCDMCNDGFNVYNGNVEGKAGSLENAPKMQSMIKQPCGGGGFIPAIDIISQDGQGSDLNIRGPCVFGGCTELFCNADFKVRKDGGEVATIKHMRPDGCCEALMAVCSKLDRYQVNFSTPMGPNDKANIALASLLVDYMFFELDDGPCYATNESCTITWCFCNVFGCLCPCQCTLHGKSNSEEE